MKNTTTIRGACALGLMLAAAQAPAQQAVYRCGQTYQQAPCVSGQGQKVEVADERTAEQRQGARAAATAEAHQARDLAAERRARESAAPSQTAPLVISARQPDDAASTADRGKSAEKRRKKKSKSDDEGARYWSPPAAKSK